jgi:AcrR family transcriptional regulator
VPAASRKTKPSRQTSDEHPSSGEKWALPAQQARSRAMRARILVAAEEMFASKGYDGARLSDIAEVAGCSVGAVYFRFKDKDALFSAIAESFRDEARTGVSRLLENAEGLAPAAVIRTFVTAGAARLSRHKGLFRAIVERGLDHPDAMDTIFRFRDELAVALETALKAKNAGFKVRVMTQMIYGFLITGVLNKRSPTKIEDSRAIAELGTACVAYFASVS